MDSPIIQIDVSGFKSIRDLSHFNLAPDLNILIGANGAGKSNFIGYFSFIRSLVLEALQQTVLMAGGADKMLYLGPSETKSLRSYLFFYFRGEPVTTRYEFTLAPTPDNRLVFIREDVHRRSDTKTDTFHLVLGHQESRIAELQGDESLEGQGQACSLLYKCISNWGIYHFHDTSGTASVRRATTVRDYDALRDDAANLAAFLLRLRFHSRDSYNLIRDTIRLVAPFFDDFLLRPESNASGDSYVLLEWRQRGSDYPFHPSQLSDGTLRFICLVTALLQPNPPSTMLFDEPELGLHPYALEIISGLIHQAASRTQVIVSTQSPVLLDKAEPEQVVVVDRVNQESTFRRLDRESLDDWLHDYTLGELWEKNVIGGRPG